MKNRKKEWKETFKDEEVLTRPLDRRLMVRLLRYAVPYWRLITLTVLALLLLTGADLALPYITKYGIDNFIVVGASPVRLEGMDPADRRDLESTAAEGLLTLEGSEEPRHLLAPSAARALDRALKRRLEENDAFGSASYYIWRQKEGPRPEVFERRPELFRAFPGGVVVRMTDLYELPVADMAAVRAGDLHGVTILAVFLLGFLGLRFFLDFVNIYGVQFAGQNAMNDLRMEVFSHLQKMSLRFFDKHPVGWLVTRGTSDIQVLNDMFSGLLINLFKDFFLLLGLVSVMLVLDWRLSLLTFTILPFLVIATFSFRRLAREAYRVVRAKVAKINAFLAENIAGMSIVQAFNRQGKNLELFRGINEEHYRARLRELYVFAVFRPLVEILSAVAIGLVIWYGGSRVLGGMTSLGTLVAFIAYVQMFFRPIQDLSEKYNLLQAAMASSERIFQILDEPVEIPNPEKPGRIENPEGRIEFENVSFTYDGENYVLKDVSFSLNPGTTLALVGPTGAGKSTIISLLSRYYDVTEGCIRMDGEDIRNLDKAWLRSQLGVVMQDVFLFTGDIRSNIRLRNRHITDEAVVQAAEQVMASQFINRLPDRYLEGVKERGATLSTGQKQLLAFARAMVFNPRVLVLDEATANVDSETESLIQESLEQLMMGRTAIVIAHRLSTVQKADRILVLQEGRIVEAGSHAELMETAGLYRLLYETQALS
ncbi:MAG: ABC transporter ATP-binding protein [Planctomycetota bacterium]